jgi:hypothetical protein
MPRRSVGAPRPPAVTGSRCSVPASIPSISLRSPAVSTAAASRLVTPIGRGARGEPEVGRGEPLQARRARLPRRGDAQQQRVLRAARRTRSRISKPLIGDPRYLNTTRSAGTDCSSSTRASPFAARSTVALWASVDCRAWWQPVLAQVGEDCHVSSELPGVDAFMRVLAAVVPLQRSCPRPSASILTLIRLRDAPR